MKVEEQIQHSYDEAITRTSSGVPRPAELAVVWSEIDGRLAQATSVAELGLDDDGDVAVHRVRSQPTMEFHGRIGDWVAEIRRQREHGETTLFVAATAGRAERTIEAAQRIRCPRRAGRGGRGRAVRRLCSWPSATCPGASACPTAFSRSTPSRTFSRRNGARPERRRSATKAFLSDLRDLKVGDFVVHVDHGIGAFVGLKQIGVGDSQQEFLELRYAGDDKLFVPVERLDLVQKYTGATRPPLDRLGGTSWERAKTRVKKAMRDMAEELLKLYAARRAVPGHAFGPDSHWQQEFEDAFEYELTPDQRSAIADIKRDMESATPMDRLLCGDVGYGKTEVAMRAAFKAVMESKQVAVLAPTTVLAFQHEKTLKERFGGFPVRIEMVSRFRSKAEQKQVLADLAAGKVDLIVGTHRLLSKDVEFRDLGLLVVDEEQRFGVSHKERIKQLRKKVDVLTMTATPIPRTLNMSLDWHPRHVDHRDAAEGSPFNSDQRREVRSADHRACHQERARPRRSGVFRPQPRGVDFLDRRDWSSGSCRKRELSIGHGQMAEETLESAMLDFMSRKFDVLLATTIVENGLDIPNANTIIINRADATGCRSSTSFADAWAVQTVPHTRIC